MGRVIKNQKAVLPVTEPPAFSRVVKAAPKEAQPFQVPQGRVLPLDQYNAVLLRAEDHMQNKRYKDAFQDLLDLEVTCFNKLRPHELLADLYLQLGQLELAKEQCVLCASIIAEESHMAPASLNDFNQLVREAGSPAEAEDAYQTLMAGEINEGDLFSGSKTALNLAAHRMNEHKYKEAEALLVAFRDRFFESAGIDK